MALGKRHSISTFIIKFLWILFLVFQESNLVICEDLEDDSLKKALEAVERRQRDLEFQENDYYGQPENIGYGFQKSLGFFDSNGPTAELGSFDSSPKVEDLQNFLLNYGGYVKDDGTDIDNGFEKRKSNFRERMGKNYLINERDGGGEDYTQSGVDFLQLLRNLWSKYRQSLPGEVNVEDLTDEQVEEILNSLYEKNGLDDYVEANGYEPFEVIPIRSRKNYRVFDRFGDRKKRYPSFGEGIYGKRNLHSQNVNYEGPTGNEFLYSLKYVNPEFNRDAVENLREEGFEVLGDEKDKDVMRVLNTALLRPKYIEVQEEMKEEEDGEEPFWLKNRNNYEEEEDAWLPGPVTFSDDGYNGSNEKRGDIAPRFFKNHNGIHLNSKRFPVKRSSVRVRKEAKNDKVSKEVKGIFATQATTVEPKKATTKKPTEVGKKENATKAEVTKSKKLVKRAEYTKEEAFPISRNEEIVDIFNVDKKSKKSIDWSQYFGIDKRSGESWLKEDYLRRTEGHLMEPKSKRFSFLNHPERPQYEIPFDTRKFSRKRFSNDIGTNIDKVENKIGDIEEKIIDDAVKYTGANTEGGKESLSQVKNKVIQRLEAAYSLEKMKNALEEFKNLIRPSGGKYLKRASTEAPKTETRTTVPKESPNLEKPLSEKKPMKKATKRVATKKEGVPDIFKPEPSDSLEFLNEVYGKKKYETDDCPVLDRILHNCLRIEEMGGRYAELLVPLCSLQQICYFCGAEIAFSTSMCDAMYLTEAQTICQGDSDCLVNARNSMLALQDLYEQDFFSENGRRFHFGSCLANPCIQRYFLSAPGAIYPLEIQK